MAKAKKRTASEKKELVQRILEECTAAIMAGVGAKTVGEKARKPARCPGRPSAG